MSKGRLEAFSDGVFAVIITFMVFNIKVPPSAGFSALLDVLPVFLSYVLSFLYVGIYWNNHHHLLQATEHVSGKFFGPTSTCFFGSRSPRSRRVGWDKTIMRRLLWRSTV